MTGFLKTALWSVDAGGAIESGGASPGPRQRPRSYSAAIRRSWMTWAMVVSRFFLAAAIALFFPPNFLNGKDCWKLLPSYLILTQAQLVPRDSMMLM